MGEAVTEVKGETSVVTGMMVDAKAALGQSSSFPEIEAQSKQPP